MYIPSFWCSIKKEAVPEINFTVLIEFKSLV